jgi:hypothetical protein
VTEQQNQPGDEAFDRWWFNEGSGMAPMPDEDQAQHVKRIARIAWHNGAYISRHHISPPFNP